MDLRFYMSSLNHRLFKLKDLSIAIEEVVALHCSKKIPQGIDSDNLIDIMVGLGWVTQTGYLYYVKL